MSCRKIQNRLALYLSADLSQRWKTKVEAHLTSCPVCQEELNRLKETLALIKEADRVEGESQVKWNEARWAELMEKISQTEMRREARLDLTARPQRKIIYGMAAAAGVLLVALLTYFLIHQTRPSSELQSAKKQSLASIKEKAQTATLQNKEVKPEREPFVSAVKKDKAAKQAAFSQSNKTEKDRWQLSEKPEIAMAESEIMPAKEKATAPSAGQEKPADFLPDRIEMVFKLPESGVQLVWILDRNFSLEGGKK